MGQTQIVTGSRGPGWQQYVAQFLQQNSANRQQDQQMQLALQKQEEAKAAAIAAQQIQDASAQDRPALAQQIIAQNPRLAPYISSLLVAAPVTPEQTLADSQTALRQQLTNSLTEATQPQRQSDLPSAVPGLTGNAFMGQPGTPNRDPFVMNEANQAVFNKGLDPHIYEDLVRRGVLTPEQYNQMVQVGAKLQPEANTVLTNAETNRHNTTLEPSEIGKNKAQAFASNASGQNSLSEIPVHKAQAESAGKVSSTAGRFTNITDEYGNLLGAWNPKTGVFEKPPVDGGRSGAIGYEERKDAGALTGMLQDNQRLRELGMKHKDVIGRISGPFYKELVRLANTDPDIAEMVQMANSLTNQRIYMMSGKQINEAEAKRLEAVNPSLATSYTDFMMRTRRFEIEISRLANRNAAIQKRGGGQQPAQQPAGDADPMGLR